MKRIIIICEGETEQEFCNTVLGPHFQARNIHVQCPRIKKSMGGIVKWEHLKKQIETHLKNDIQAHVTLLIDYYGLDEKYEFPGWHEAEKSVDKNFRMDILEKAMKEDIWDTHRHRFMPYIQLHEFEGLLFNDIEVFKEWIPSEQLVGMKELEDTFKQFENPEMINDKKETSPSHRLERIIQGYRKVLDGNILASEIGLDRIRAKSPRFNHWIEKIEQLND